LFDDTEIFGKVIDVDSANVKVQTENKNLVIIPRNNILYYSTELEPSKYKYSFSLLGGISLMTDENYYHGYNGSGGSTIFPNFNLAGIFFISDTKAIKVDAGYTYVKRTYDDGWYPANHPEYRSTYEGGDLSMFSLKGNLLLGKFTPDEKILLYGSIGLGIHYTKKQDEIYSSWHQSYPDTATWIHESYTYHYNGEVNLLLSLGASAGYRFTKRFGVKAEIEYNLMGGEYFIFWGGRSYFPIRAGIFYVF
jgi:hypothetical protein